MVKKISQKDKNYQELIDEKIKNLEKNILNLEYDIEKLEKNIEKNIENIKENTQNIIIIELNDIIKEIDKKNNIILKKIEEENNIKFKKIKIELDKELIEINSIVDDYNNDLKNQIKTTKESLLNKIDSLDEALRGNLSTGNIGIIAKLKEIFKLITDKGKQIKDIDKRFWWAIRIIGIILLILLGAEIFGISIIKIKNVIKSDTTKQVQPIKQINNNPEIQIKESK